MKEQNEWVFYKDIEWSDPKFNQFNIDTRDFHCGYRKLKESDEIWDRVIKYPNYYHTEEELTSLIDRLFEESGGEGDWRMLELQSSDSKALNWRLKYLRIYRTDEGFIICNSESEPLKKEVLSCKVNQKYLNHQ